MKEYLTVKDLIEMLKDMPMDAPVVLDDDPQSLGYVNNCAFYKDYFNDGVDCVVIED